MKLVCILKQYFQQCSSYSSKERPEFKNVPKEWISGELTASQVQNETAPLGGECFKLVI